MWIAACDDDEEFGKQIIACLEGIISRDDQLTLYNSGFELIDAAYRSMQPIDLVLLDIEMPGFSGIETAKELREINAGTVIVIITGFIQYALRCYEIRAFHYLLKPIDTVKLKSTIDEVRGMKLCEVQKSLHIATREHHTFIPLGDLIYIESYRRALYAHTRGAFYKYYKQISKVDQELSRDGFYRIHKSYIVNLAHIKKVEKSLLLVVLSSGKVLPVGKRNLKGLISSLIDTRRTFHGIV